MGNATAVTYLNGNLPVCDLCLMGAQGNSAMLKDWGTPEENAAWGEL